MITIKTLSYDKAVNIFNHMSDKCFKQEPSYCNLAAQTTNSISEFHAAYLETELIAYWNVRIKKSPLNILGIAYVPHGPLICYNGREFSEERLQEVLMAMINYYADENGLCLRINPHLQGGINNHLIDNALIKTGFTHQDTQYKSFVVDLDREMDVIRKNLHPKWRGHLNKSEKFEQVISIDNSAVTFDRLQAMLSILAGRKNFTVSQDASFFKEAAMNSAVAEKYQIFSLEYENEIISMALGSFFGDTATYLLGATSHAGRPTRAAYAIQWHMMQYAKSIGIKYYDLGGVDKLENPNVFEFKERTKGRYISIYNEYQYHPSKVHKFSLNLSEKIYRKLKKA